MKIFLFTSFLISSLFFPAIKAVEPSQDYLDDLDQAMYIEYATMKMEMYKDGKVVRYYDLEFFRLDSKMRMEFTAPAVEKGRRMLNDNSSLWMYLPRTSKVMKLPFKQAFMGSDASNADLMRMCFKNDYEVVNVREKENQMVELELKAKNIDVAYHKVVVHYDTKRKILLKQEMYSVSDKLIKTILYENIIQSEGKYIPATMIIKEELQKNTQTKLIYTNIKERNKQPAEFFTLGSLKR